MPTFRRSNPPGRGWAVAVAAFTVFGLVSCTRAAPTAVVAPTTAAAVGTAAAPATVGTTSPTVGTTTGLPATTPNLTTTSSTASRVTTEPATTGSAPAGTCVGGHCYQLDPVRQLPPGVATESSGIVASAKSAGAYFVVDDGTGADRIVAVRSNGSFIADIRIAGMSADNAEALATGRCPDRAGRCFYVGDIGDNAAQRAQISIFRIAEPSLSPAPTDPVPADKWDYTYPDGPHNAEAMLVAPDGSVLVITKSAINSKTAKVPPHRIYRGAPGGGQLRFVSSFTPPEPAERLQSLFTGTVVTDASYADGRVLLLTYDEVIEYLAPTPKADPASFPSWPHHELPDPPMIQSEGITADISGCGYEVTSEAGPGGTRAGLAGVSCR